MKLIIALTSSLYLASALPSRTPNQQLQAALQECEYPAQLNNEEDIKSFANCFYSSTDLQTKVDEKVSPYKQLANRLTKVYENNQHDKELMKKRMKGVMIKNSELFGMSKREAAAKWNSSEDEIIAMVAAMNIDSLKEYANKDISTIVDEAEQEVSDYLAPIISENQEWYDMGMDFWNAFKNTETGQQLQEKIEEVEQIVEENGDKSLTEIGKEIAENYDVEGKVQELEAEAEAAIENISQ